MIIEHNMKSFVLFPFLVVCATSHYTQNSYNCNEFLIQDKKSNKKKTSTNLYRLLFKEIERTDKVELEISEGVPKESISLKLWSLKLRRRGLNYRHVWFNGTNRVTLILTKGRGEMRDFNYIYILFEKGVNIIDFNSNELVQY